jgi:hypothetical protein
MKISHLLDDLTKMPPDMLLITNAPWSLDNTSSAMLPMLLASIENCSDLCICIPVDLHESTEKTTRKRRPFRANALERFIPTEGIKQGVFVEHSSTNTPYFTVLRVYISEKGFVQ